MQEKERPMLVVTLSGCALFSSAANIVELVRAGLGTKEEEQRDQTVNADAQQVQNKPKNKKGITVHHNCPFTSSNLFRQKTGSM
jgi:hypothetical protein